MILTGKEAAAMIDISLVRTQHTISDIRDVVELAKKYRFINVHVLPCWFANLAEMLHDVGGVYVGSPVGFPSGAATTLTKVVEAEQLIRDGVEEMDVVMNIGKLKAGDDTYVRNELREIIGMTNGKVKTKVIIEQSVLDEKELFHACDLVVDSGADYIKTGTGWIPAPLDLKRIQEIKSHCGSKIKLKVAGGVRTRKEFISLVEMGVERVGINAVSALQIVTELNKHPYCSGEDMLVAK